jgi:hypothetical protein
MNTERKLISNKNPQIRETCLRTQTFFSSLQQFHNFLLSEMFIIDDPFTLEVPKIERPPFNDDPIVDIPEMYKGREKWMPPESPMKDTPMVSFWLIFALLAE